MICFFRGMSFVALPLNVHYLLCHYPRRCYRFRRVISVPVTVRACFIYGCGGK